MAIFLANLISNGIAVNTALAIAIGFVIFYFVVLGQNKTDRSIKEKNDNKQNDEVVLTKETEIEKDVTHTIEKTDDSVVLKVLQKVEPSLARFDATTAMTNMIACTYIREQFPHKKSNNTSFLDDLVAEKSSMTVTKPRSAFAKVEGLKFGSGSNEFIKDENENNFVEEEENVVDSAMKVIAPVTAAIATAVAATIVTEAPKATSERFLADFEATTAITILEAQQYIAKAPRPVLAAFEATTAITALEAQQYIDAIPKAPRPFLAAYNATVAATAFEVQEYLASLPKTPRPSFAAYNATVADTALNAQNFVCNLPKAPKPFLFAFEATTAITALEAQKFVASMSQYNLNKEIQQECSIPANIDNITFAFNTSSNLASLEATNASQLLQTQNYLQQQQEASDSDIEVEIEEDLSSPTTTPSTSTSSLHSETCKFSAIAAASAVSNKINTFDNHDYNKTWKKIINEGIMTNEPTRLENPAVAVPNNGQKRLWTREEKIEKQIQSHMPKMKNRCDYWPNCTNKHCKFSHPTLPCRIGDDCPFGKRCSFIHPKDYSEPPKRRNTTSNANGGGSSKNPYRNNPNNRSSSYSSTADNTQPKPQLSI